MNAFIKITYLIFTYHAWLGIQAGFLDQMCMWDWFFGFGLIVQAVYIWFWKYPLYEVIHAIGKFKRRYLRSLGAQTRWIKRLRELVEVLYIFTRKLNQNILITSD